MNTSLTEILNQINLTSSASALNFLERIKYVLITLDIKEFKDIAEGLRAYYNFDISIENDLLVNKILAILAALYFYQEKDQRNSILLQLNKLFITSAENNEAKRFLSIIEYFFNNLSDILTTVDKENDNHRKKLVLMERVGKFIEDKVVRDKTVDLMLLMA